MADEITLSSHFGHAWGWDGRLVDMTSAPGGDGAEEEADRGASVGFEFALVLQVLGDQHRMAEVDQRDHHQPGGFPRVHLFELAAFDAVAQDRFEHHAHVLFVDADSVPTELDRGQHDVINRSEERRVGKEWSYERWRNR